MLNQLRKKLRGILKESTVLEYKAQEIWEANSKSKNPNMKKYYAGEAARLKEESIDLAARRLDILHRIAFMEDE